MLMEHSGQGLREVLDVLASQGGLLGLSGGLSGDLRDLEQAAEEGNRDAQLALDVYVFEIRRQLGGMLVALGGCDALVFTGGIGENGQAIRSSVCRDLSELGLVLDEQKNAAVHGESKINASASRAEIWVVPTNEELVVARQTLAAVAADSN
jgi:acetate kinase